MRRFISFAIIYISVLFAPICIGKPQIIQPDPSFQMVILDGWRLIDSDAMSIFNNMNGRVGRQRYDIGIQRIKSKHVFDYPYLLVQIKNDGKHPTKNELNNLKFGNTFDLFSKEAYGKLTNNEIYFDKYQNSVFFVTEIKDGNGNILSGVNVAYLTKNGRVSVICYFKKSEIDKYLHEMGYMAATVLIDDFYNYLPEKIKEPQGNNK